LHAIGRERFEPKYEICFEIIIKLPRGKPLASATRRDSAATASVA
jgi:hypothetical protein